MTISSLVVFLSQFWSSQLLHEGSNCCFFTCIQVFQEAGKIVWCFHLFENFLHNFLWSARSKSLALSRSRNRFFSGITCFLYDPANVDSVISGSSAFLKSSSYAWKFHVHILLKPCLKDFEHNLAEVKASSYNVGDPCLIPGSALSPGEGNGNSLQYSCLENPMEGKAW